MDTPKTLVLGATGATGHLLVEQLLDPGHSVKAVVRSAERLPQKVLSNHNLEIINGNVLDIDSEQLSAIVRDCDAVASCLGHNISLKGVFGPPRKLVTQSVHRIGQAIRANRPGRPVKFVLMNTVGNRNRDLQEDYSLGDRMVIGVMRWLVPPQSDNEQAAEYLRTQIGQNDKYLEWVAVRPDTLFDAEGVSEYETHPSPLESGISGSRKTGRINVAHFMAELLTDKGLWEKWKGQMPVVYNK